MYTIGFAHSLNPKNANGFMSNQTFKKIIGREESSCQIYTLSSIVMAYLANDLGEKMHYTYEMASNA